jgi:hypothetical protein
LIRPCSNSKLCSTGFFRLDWPVVGSKLVRHRLLYSTDEIHGLSMIKQALLVFDQYKSLPTLLVI